MVLPLFVLAGVLCSSKALFTVTLTFLANYVEAKSKLKAIPNAALRPPRNMTRAELINVAREKLQMDVTNHINFVFCGASGAGKSTLINALLGREDVDFVKGKPHDMFDSAPTGIWQTTMQTLCYGYSDEHDLQRVRLWDTAGCGTCQHPSAKYFQENVLYAFDVIVVVAENEPGEYEYNILKDAQKQNIPAVIVITKLEDKVESKVRKLSSARNPIRPDYERIIPQTIDEARQHVNTCLDRKRLREIPVFVVSAWKYRDLTMDREGLQDINHEENRSNQGVFPTEVSGRDNSNRDINIDTARDRTDSIQTLAEQENHKRNMSLSSEMNQMLTYLADKATARRS